jgi:hypothetical protein
MTFDEIPEGERIIKFKVDRDDAVIQSIYEKVRSCRQWMSEFEEMHIRINKN